LIRKTAPIKEKTRGSFKLGGKEIQTGGQKILKKKKKRARQSGTWATESYCIGRPKTRRCPTKKIKGKKMKWGTEKRGEKRENFKEK